MILVKECFRTGGFSSDSLGTNLEPPNASQSFLAKCGAARAALFDGTDVTQLEPKSSDVTTGRKIAAKCEVAIPAVPLRSVPTIDVLWKSKESKPHGRDRDEGQKKAKTNDDTVHREDELWKDELDKLAEIIDDAKEFISLMDVKYPTPKRGRDSESVMLRNLGGSASGKRLKHNSGISVAAQGEIETISQDDDEVSLLSQAEWTASQQHFSHKKNECFEPSIGKLAKDIERQSSLKIGGECKIDLISPGTKSDKPSVMSCNPELTKVKCRDIQQHCSSDSDDELKIFDDEDSATYSTTSNHKELINLEIMQHDHPRGREVMEALKLYKKEYMKLLKDHVSYPKEGKTTKGPHFVAAQLVKDKGVRVSTDKPFGHIPGVEIGDEFSLRAELAIIGLNRQFNKGIDYVRLHGKIYATSVVNSWRYENMAKEGDILIYFGEGGNSKTCVKGARADQKLTRGNLALSNNMEMEFPVRVIHKRKCLAESKTLGANDKRDYVYVYDGLYKVNRYWHERETQTCKLVYKFELQRMPGQPTIHGTHIEFRKQIHSSEDCDALQGKVNTTVVNGMEKETQSLLDKETFEVVDGVRGPPRNHETDEKWEKQIQATEICVLDDVSKGKEKFKVRVVNGVDDSLPSPFTYITSIIYPYWNWLREPVGCDCTSGCSDSVQCPCVVKNRGEIPYTEKGKLMRAKTNKIVHECGPSCKCPPSCMNRVGQHGPCIELEIFKTKSMGWGVRSRDLITPGTFICEYMGELLGEDEADRRVGNDQYLFDICHGKSKRDDFSLDAAKCGNVSRFINHSCDPNVFAQKVLYDHDEKRMPHIMFFASKNIRPKQELMYDYNYTKIRVRDADGNIKRKACHCGSRKCTGRLY